MADRSRIPASTYRLQLNRNFTFADATAIVPYLARLGISHCYASPYLKARAGSAHGYDIVDHNALNPEIGDEQSFDAFVAALRDNGMGHILDLVPNHMGIFGHDNVWWLDVLENGPASAFAFYFDIDWRPNKEALRGKVLVPVLGDHYGKVLEDGQLQLRFDPDRGEFSVWYFEHRFPFDPATYPMLLEHELAAFLEGRDEGEPDSQDLRALISAFGHLPARWDQGEEKLAERHRDKEVHKRHLAELYTRSMDVAAHINQVVILFNGRKGDADSFGPLHRILEQQAYRLSFWQVASDEINYRQFFDISDLAGLRIEEPEVFANTHRFVLELLREGKLDGLRIDHPDGLFDPAGYYDRLVREGSAAIGLPPPTAGPPGFYLVVEKILASYEHLPANWPVHGTTGYEFANLAGGLLVYAPTEHEFDRVANRFTGLRKSFDELLVERKLLVINTQLSSELTVLANMLDQLAQLNRYTRDFTLFGLRNAFQLVVACFPVYRTYIIDQRDISDEERHYIEWAVAWAKQRTPAVDPGIFDFIRDVLLGEGAAAENDDLRARALAFTMKAQQYTGPVMAKGLEDTAFYVYNRLVSLNEVGGDPRRFGTTISAFHRSCQERRQQWPHAMLATSTHDSKRSEDVRARIDVLTELPAEWQRNVGRWTRLNRVRKGEVDGQPAPSRNDEYLLYQTLVGTWPLEPFDDDSFDAYRERINGYMLKAVREAKSHTSWINPNQEYEAAVRHFVDGLLASAGNRFLTDFTPFVHYVSRLGLYNSLSQLLLKLTAPGVPDFYQGNEFWEFSLVDPDNRHPVDYPSRDASLAAMEHAWRVDREALVSSLSANLNDGRIKQFITWRLLQIRRRFSELFTTGEYLPLACDGARAEHLCAFARRLDGQALITIVPRWFARLLVEPERPIGAIDWGDTRVQWLSAGDWQNLFTGNRLSAQENVPAADLFANFPLASFANFPID